MAGPTAALTLVAGTRTGAGWVTAASTRNSGTWVRLRGASATLGVGDESGTLVSWVSMAAMHETVLEFIKSLTQVMQSSFTLSKGQSTVPSDSHDSVRASASEEDSPATKTTLTSLPKEGLFIKSRPVPASRAAGLSPRTLF